MNFIMSILSECLCVLGFFLLTLSFEFQDKRKHGLCFVYFKELFMHLRHWHTSLHFILLQKMNSGFLPKQFSSPDLNVIDGMAKLEKEHRLVVAFELKKGMEEMEIWA